jgi:hypothetical protein
MLPRAPQLNNNYNNNSRVMMRLEELVKLKTKLMTLLGIEPATLRLVA